jgi:hypothetical protein
MIKNLGHVHPLGRSAPKANFMRLVFCIASLLSLLGCGKDKVLVVAKESFLQETSPQLKVMRERLLGELSSCEDGIKELKKLVKGFNQQTAIAAVEAKIKSLELRSDALKKQLNRIDEEVERGVALRRINQIDGGGVVNQDLSGVMKDCESALGDAKKARTQLETELGMPSAGLNLDSARNQATTIERMNAPKVIDNSKSMQNSRPAPSASNMASWTNLDGKSIQAELVVLEGTDVVLRLRDGHTYVYPISKLSTSSQALARRLAPSQKNFSEEETVTVGGLFYRVINTSDGYMNMRSGPGLQFQIRGRITGAARGIEQIGNLVYDRKEAIYWMPVRFGGVEGYVSANFLQPE